MALQDFFDGLLQAIDGLFCGETQIKPCPQFTGDHIRRARSGGNIRDLKSGGLKVLVAIIPDAGGQFRERGRQRVHGIVGQLRIGDVSLNPMDRQTPAQTAASADFDGIAQRVLARGFPDQAPVDALLALAQHFDHPTGAIDGRPFLIAGDQEGNRAAMLRVLSDEFLAGGQHGG